MGRSIQLDSNSVTIVGVLPRDFEFAPRGNAQIWVPLHIGGPMATARNLRWISVVGRLARGATLAQAEAEMALINSRLAAAYPKENGATTRDRRSADAIASWGSSGRCFWCCSERWDSCC